MASINPSQPTLIGVGSSRIRVTRNPAFRVRQAVRDNNVALLSRLQHKIDLRNTDKSRLTSLSWAAVEGCLEVFEWLLLDYGHDDQELSRDADHNTIFHLLAAVPSPPTLSPHTHLILSSPEFPPRPVTRSHTELTAISLRMTEVYYTLFPFLLDWSNSGGKTALHIAAQAGNSPFISLLCDLGADVDLADLQGNTPLHYASAWGHSESARVLLERGAILSVRNFEGFTPSDFAFSNNVRKDLERIAQTLYEERRTRREERARVREREQREQRDQLQRDRDGSVARLRSGSASTGASFGSGLSSGAASSQPRFDEPPLPPLPVDMRLHRVSPAPQMSRQGSDASVPTSTSVNLATLQGPPQLTSSRPIQSRSPSMPTPPMTLGTASNAQPAPFITQSAPMRRANSAQTNGLGQNDHQGITHAL